MRPEAPPAMRAAWAWCLAYTMVAPAVARDRRRAELRSHLWESEAAGVAPARVLLAAVRGGLDDMLWAVAVCAGEVARGLLSPTPYMVVAAGFPVVGWLTSTGSSSSVAHPHQLLAAAGGVAMLVVAAATWARQQLHR